MALQRRFPPGMGIESIVGCTLHSKLEFRKEQTKNLRRAAGMKVARYQENTPGAQAMENWPHCAGLIDSGFGIQPDGKEEAARVAMLHREVHGQIAPIAIHITAAGVKAAGHNHLRSPTLRSQVSA